MKYVSVTVWKHSESIDWAKMQEMLSENMKKPVTPVGTTVRWFDIDEYTHGSVLTFASLEAFENHKSKLEANRKESSDDLGITLVHKHDGLIRAEGTRS